MLGPNIDFHIAALSVPSGAAIHRNFHFPLSYHIVFVKVCRDQPWFASDRPVVMETPRELSIDPAMRSKILSACDFREEISNDPRFEGGMRLWPLEIEESWGMRDCGIHRSRILHVKCRTVIRHCFAPVVETGGVRDRDQAYRPQGSIRLQLE